MIRSLLISVLIGGMALGVAHASEIVTVDGTKVRIPEGMTSFGPMKEGLEATGLQAALDKMFFPVRGQVTGLALFRNPRHPDNSMAIGEAPSKLLDWPEDAASLIAPVQGTAGTNHRIYAVRTKSHVVPVVTLECGYGAFQLDAGRPLPPDHARCVATGRFTKDIGFELRSPDFQDEGDVNALALDVGEAVEAIFPES